jgi:hypothetical protein
LRRYKAFVSPTEPSQLRDNTPASIFKKFNKESIEMAEE